MKYDVDYFIKKFEAIPDEKWCINEIDNGRGQRCALGHTWGLFGETKETEALCNVMNWRVSFINNGESHDYKQSTPRARILAALNDIKNNS